MEEFDGDHAVERRHGDGYPRLLLPHQRAVKKYKGFQGPAGQGGMAGPAGAEEQVAAQASF